MTDNLLGYWRTTGENDLAPFFQYAPVMMHIVDGEGRIERVSEFWCETLGYEREEVIGRRSIDFLTPESRRHTSNTLMPSLFREGRLTNAELDFVRKDGSVLHTLLSAVCRHDEDSGSTRGLAVVLDNTAARQAQQDLRKQARAAEVANRAKSSFLANMSHELRTPLNGVIGMASALSQTSMSGSQEKMLAVLSRSGHQLLSLIDDIIDLTKIESGQMSMETEVFDPNDVLKDVSDLYRARAANKGITLRNGAPLEIDAQIIGNPARIRQVLTNLVSNAMKFTDEGHIALAASLTEGDPEGEQYLTIQVIDTGSGVPDLHKDAIFGRFHRGEHETDHAYEGAGLGLTIARTICNLHGGSLEIGDTPGGGATFTAHFRIEQRPAPAHGNGALATVEDLNRLETPLRILVAEDNETNRMVLEAMLSVAPVRLVFAENGKIALEQWDRDAFDGAIIDIRMPIVGGLEVMRRIRNEEARLDARPVPLVACSANVMTEQVNSYLTAGFDQFLPKPVPMADLTECLLWMAQQRSGRSKRKRREAV